MLIYRLSDRVPVKIGDVTFILAPLSMKQKQELLSHMRVKEGEERVDAAKYAFANVKKSVKAVEGVETLDGVFSVEFDENGELTDECVELLLSIDPKGLLRHSCDLFQFAALKDGDLEGVTVDLTRAKALKKK